MKYTNFYSLSNENILYEIQLIKGSYNHVSRGHVIKDRLVKIAYLLEKKNINLIELVVHYCNDCNKYFDFEESFKIQLNNYGIKINSLLIQPYDEYNELIISESFGLNEHSKLSLLGYSVGQKGKSKMERQRIIHFVIDNNIMTTSQIKKHLSYLIRYNGKKAHMNQAVEDWKEDIDFVNEYIRIISEG